MKHLLLFAGSLALVALSSAECYALDKQSAAHGGSVAGNESGMALSGSVLLGVALYNPSYAARPDNTGHALGRLAPHLDFDIIGRRLSIPLDINIFTDRDRRGAEKLIPSELDFITGVTSTWGLNKYTAVEGGLRIERDGPVDRGKYAQTYGDARVRLLYAFELGDSCFASALAAKSLSGALTLGWFFWNPSYAARPDNSGLAVLRYALNSSFSLLDGYLVPSFDLTSFTDRRRPLLPTELDAVFSLSTHAKIFGFQLSYERDMPLDRRTLIQQLLMLSSSVQFEIF